MFVDLTLPISNKLPNFPDSPTPQFLNWSNLKQDGYNLELLFMSTHSGTHIDAPFHFVQNGRTVEDIPIHRLMCTAILIRIPKTANKAISKSDIISFEKQNGKIPDNSTIIFQTGWQKNLHKKNFFTENPGLSKDAAQYIISKKINLVGIDSPSIDLGNNKKFTVHHLLSKKDILIVENLTKLEKIKEIKFSLVVLPLKLLNASGSPVRAVGIYSNK